MVTISCFALFHHLDSSPRLAALFFSDKELETEELSIPLKMNNQVVVYSCIRILLWHKEC